MLTAILTGVFAMTTPLAQVTGAPLDYMHEEVVLSGYLAAGPGTAKRPGVLIIHDWNGPDDYEFGRARQLAGMGYVALAADIYGKENRPKTQGDNARLAGIYRGNRSLFRARLQAGLDALKKDPRVDSTKVAAIGYCFGGTGVLEMARGGMDLAGVVSFHGSLDSPTPADMANAKAKMLVLHALNDPVVPRSALNGFIDEVNAAKKDFQLVIYNLTTHSFTVPGSGYDADADRRSWAKMTEFFREIFGS